jgi:nucleotide-binding universal stress UspA family protein
MTPALVTAVVVLSLALLGLAIAHLHYRRRPPSMPATTRRILFPFTFRALSQPVLDAALRLASAEEATLVPVFLARVPLHLPPDTPLPRQGGMAIPLLEAIEQRAARYGVPVDARIERGRDYRHALCQAIAHERYDRIVTAASRRGDDGFHADDIAWLLENAPGELAILRPGREETIRVPGAPVGGYSRLAGEAPNGSEKRTGGPTARGSSPPPGSVTAPMSPRR